MTDSKKCTATNHQSFSQNKGQHEERSVGRADRNRLSKGGPAGSRGNAPSFAHDFNSEHSFSYASISEVSLSTGSNGVTGKALRTRGTRHLHSPSCVYQG